MNGQVNFSLTQKNKTTEHNGLLSKNQSDAVVTKYPFPSLDFTVDERDLSVLKDIFGVCGDANGQDIQKMITIEDGVEGRVCKLQCPSEITSLPPSIGRLHSLKELNLQDTHKLKSLPDEIGNPREPDQVKSS